MKESLHNQDRRDRRGSRGFQEVQGTHVAEQTAMPCGVMRFDGGQQGGRLREYHEAQQEDNNQTPPVVRHLTHHAGNLIIDAG